MEKFQNHCLENGKQIFLKKFADVHFVVGDPNAELVRVPAHKVLLATDSKVFEAMFYGDLKETGDVHVPDSTESAFIEFLQYFYLSEVKLTAKNVADVLHLGDKYSVKKCVIDCIQFLIRTIDVENVCVRLGLAILYDKKTLMAACEKHIIVNTEAVFNSSGFLECNRDVVGHILSMNMLSCDEEDVFAACMAWVRAKSKCSEVTLELVQQHLGDLYYKIRVASFQIEKFAALEQKYQNVLSKNALEICFIIVLPDYVANSKFSKAQRKAEFNRESVVTIHRILDQINYDRQAAHNFEFTSIAVDQAIILGGLTFTEINTGLQDDPMPCSVAVDLEITETDVATGAALKCLLKTQIELDSNGSTVKLPHAVLLRPGFAYEIQMGRFPAFHHFILRQAHRMCWGVGKTLESVYRP